MGTTENFGLTTLTEGESLDKDGYKFVNADRHLIDRLIKQMFDHHHNNIPGDEPVAPDAPNLTLSVTGGGIPAGRRLYYRITLVDANDNETISSPTVYVDAPNPIQEPAAPSVSSVSSGGSLSAGQYYYMITAYTSVNTLETKGKHVVNETLISGSTNAITLTLPSVPSGATGFNIYRRGPGDSRYKYLDSTTLTTYEDDGGTTPSPNRTLPTRNTTNSANKVLISYPGSTPDVPADYTWKIYRTFDQTDWNNSLLHHVVELEGSEVDPDYEDIGSRTFLGSPPSTQYTINAPEKISLTDMDEVQGTLPPGKVYQLVEVDFQIEGPVVAENGQYIWRCNYTEAMIDTFSGTLGLDSYPIVDPILVDIKKYDVGAEDWFTILGSQLEIPVNESIGFLVLSELDDQFIGLGDLLRFDVTQAGGSATPIDENLNLQMVIWAKHGSETTSFDW